MAEERPSASWHDRFFWVMQEPLAVLASDGRIIAANAAASRLLGPAAAQGVSAYDAVVPEDGPALANAVGRAVVEGRASAEVRSVVDGRWLDWCMSSDGGELFTVVHDISDRRDAEN